jgi:hypothetical protein
MNFSKASRLDRNLDANSAGHIILTNSTGQSFKTWLRAYQIKRLCVFKTWGARCAMQSLDQPVLLICLVHLRAKDLLQLALSSKWGQAQAETAVAVAIKRYEQSVSSTASAECVFETFYRAEIGALLKAVTVSPFQLGQFWISCRWIQLWKQWQQSISVSKSAKRSLSKKKTKAKAKRAALGVWFDFDYYISHGLLAVQLPAHP